MKRCRLWWALALVSVMVAGDVRAVSLPPLNLVNLLDLSTSILVGTVTSVTDGIDPTYGLPYTEVTFFVEETLQGTQIPGEPYAFRQLGLIRPRPSADGTRIIPEAPPGIPRFNAGVRLVLFLSPPASVTGLQSTVGLSIGNFSLTAANAVNGLDNAGVFQNISLADGLATDNDERLLATTAGAVNQADFLSFIRRAVEGNWIHTCKMWSTDQGTPQCGGRSPLERPRRRTLSDPNQTPTTTTLGIK